MRKTPPAADDMQRIINAAATLQAKSKFWVSTVGMGWRLAITVLGPIIIGVKLDEAFKSSPSYTLVGFMLAVAGASAVVWKTVKEVNAETEAADTARKAELQKLAAQLPDPSAPKSNPKQGERP